jgi:saccharopine dehydrogenase-like NADP-dependent oxidoreductase
VDLGIPNMHEKTMRYPGHASMMRAFREAGFFSKEPVRVGDVTVRPLDVTAALLFPYWSYEPGERDLTVMQVEAEGRRDRRRVRLHWDLVDYYDEPSRLSSMARTTGFVATALVRRMLAGEFADLRGVLPPEALGRREGVLDGVIADLQARGIRITRREEPLAG